ncbi:signal peptidase I [Amycolatopsis mediterranei S699]|uniref:Mitochondrial inner membrane protease subunit 2 n=2 Tax=Amycolatopsis mediterranei TaxID=33910 RepID=A0A0H3D6H2_AMYMU|nr:S26 family signal peptidase [Amycolatopsis mediterranei]ADJ45718.1 signal peptidase I [Amycolatopsis mediterranei U32]AEK42499.1 signal peptidase I [Amycolatopsis mediterranei S699]AFO77428.1 signal peptidase I [Amycolatopsis mediterranei S699]AGT84556.1 signal peptidase I [Amycolatopsis mediterranei RB]KDO05765.1 signal peptidase I [Amycolatopsis mediterranei]
MAGLAVGAVVVLALLVLLRRRYVVARVWGHSMSPTFHDGERVVATRRRHYRVGDVIVFRPRSRTTDVAWRIKRIAAVAGDPVPAWLETDHPVVPAGRVVVVGDNTGHSEDSRQLGYIDLAAVAGAVPHRAAPEGS